jgi:hypothetical protein
MVGVIAPEVVEEEVLSDLRITRQRVLPILVDAPQMSREQHFVTASGERCRHHVAVGRAVSDQIKAVDTLSDRLVRHSGRRLPRLLHEILRARPDGTDVKTGLPQSAVLHQFCPLPEKAD